jgi:hypothetical protein
MTTTTLDEATAANPNEKANSSTADPTTSELLTLIVEQRQQFEARLGVLEAENARLRSPVGLVAVDRHAHPENDTTNNGDEVSNRRGFLRGAAAVAAGAGLLLAGRTEQAAAVDGSAIIQGQTNTGTGTTTITSTGNQALKVNGAPNSEGVFGVCDGWAVFGSSNTGFAVRGVTNTGYSLFAAGTNPRIGINASSYPSAPTTGTFNTGDIIKNPSGNLWLCVTGGTPGTWRRIGGPISRTTLPTPKRHTSRLHRERNRHRSRNHGNKHLTSNHKPRPSPSTRRLSSNQRNHRHIAPTHPAPQEPSQPQAT